MSVRSIDMQVTINKVNDYTNKANYNNQKTQIEQFGYAEETKKNTEKEIKQVVSSEKTEHKRVDRDGNNKQHNKWDGSRRNKRNSKNNSDNTRGQLLINDVKGRNIDVEI